MACIKSVFFLAPSPPTGATGGLFFAISASRQAQDYETHGG